jgi:hypothetical protein
MCRRDGFEGVAVATAAVQNVMRRSWEESQRLLQFQRHDSVSYIQDFHHRMRWIRRLIWPLRWPIRMYLKRKSAEVVGQRRSS